MGNILDAASSYWAAHGRSLDEVVEQHRLALVTRCLFESPSRAREILGDGSETIGGGMRLASVAFDAESRSAVMVVGDSDYPQSTMFMVGRV